MSVSSFGVFRFSFSVFRSGSNKHAGIVPFLSFTENGKLKTVF